MSRPIWGLVIGFVVVLLMIVIIWLRFTEKIENLSDSTRETIAE